MLPRGAAISQAPRTLRIKYMTRTGYLVYPGVGCALILTNLYKSAQYSVFFNQYTKHVDLSTSPADPLVEYAIQMLNMLINPTVAIVAFSIVCLFQVVRASQCKEVYFTSDKCRSSSYITVVGQRVLKGSRDVRIKLGAPQTESTWHCGDSRERLGWDDNANQIRVNFLADGDVQWTVYNCDDLTGPVQAGIQCSDEAFSTACPGNANSNTTCVFEVSSSTTFIDKTTTTAQVTGSVAATVSSQVTAEVSGSLKFERSKATQVTFGQKSYLVIPGGFKFCSYSDATSVKDVLAPTGFKWQCTLTKFVQTKLSYAGACSDLPKCSKRVCIAGQPAGSGAAKSVFSILPIVVAYNVIVQIFAF